LNNAPRFDAEIENELERAPTLGKKKKKKKKKVEENEDGLYNQ